MTTKYRYRVWDVDDLIEEPRTAYDWEDAIVRAAGRVRMFEKRADSYPGRFTYDIVKATWIDTLLCKLFGAS